MTNCCLQLFFFFFSPTNNYNNMERLSEPPFNPADRYDYCQDIFLDCEFLHSWSDLLERSKSTSETPGRLLDLHPRSQSTRHGGPDWKAGAFLPYVNNPPPEPGCQHVWSTAAPRVEPNKKLFTQINSQITTRWAVLITFWKSVGKAHRRGSF